MLPPPQPTSDAGCSGARSQPVTADALDPAPGAYGEADPRTYQISRLDQNIASPSPTKQVSSAAPTNQRVISCRSLV